APKPTAVVGTDVDAHSLLLHQCVDVLGLSARASHCCRNERIVYVGDLVRTTERDLLLLPNFGRISLHEIKEVLAERGLHLGMDVPEWKEVRAQLDQPSIAPTQPDLTIAPKSKPRHRVHAHKRRRNAAICRELAEDNTATFASVAAKHGITRERVH